MTETRTDCLLDRNLLLRLSANYVNEDKVSDKIILRELVEFFLRIGPNMIDESSRFESIGVTATFHLLSKSGRNCEAHFLIDANWLTIQIGKGWGEFLFAQEIKDWTDVKKLRDALNDFFCNPVSEVLVFCDHKLLQCRYSIPFKGERGDEVYTFGSKFGFCWFWQTKRIERHEYDRWLS